MAFDYKAYRDTNKERIRARQAAYYQRNKERIRRQIKERMQKPEAIAMRNARLRLRLATDPEFRAERLRLCRDWARRNRVQVNATARETTAHKTRLVRQTKTGKACSGCGESDIRCLDYHHTDPENKVDNISRLVTQRVRDDLILAEIAKCVLVCANCHRKLHHGG